MCRATRATDSPAILAFFRNRRSVVGDRRLVRLHIGQLDFAVAATRATGFSVGDSIQLFSSAKQSY